MKEINPAPSTGREIGNNNADLFAKKGRGFDDIPHEELVARVKHTVAQAKERWETKWGKDTFEPVSWIGENLTNLAMSESFRNTVRPTKEKTGYRLSLAWDAVTEPYLKN